MRKLSQCLSREAKTLAVMSYGYELSCHGTHKQIEQICQKVQTGKECRLFCQAACEGLKKLSNVERALLVGVYIKRIAIKDIAKRNNASVSTLYRRLMQARSNFKNCLTSLGYDEQWFVTNYSHFDFFSDDLS